MKLKKIRELIYEHGQEEEIKQILYKSKEPILIKIKNFPDKFTLDYFAERVGGQTSYSIFDNDFFTSQQSGDFQTVVAQIKNNMPYRIFGQILSREESAKIERHVPLWQKIPLRPRFFNKIFKVAYFFGGKGSHTSMHFDREHCCNLHLCLSGKKQLLLFTGDHSEHLYKLPFIGDSLIDFGLPLEDIQKNFPRINQAEGYNVFLEKGDMVFLPRNCWHYTTYLDASSSATYVFYPKKMLHLYGYFTGHFYLGYKGRKGFHIAEWSFFKKFDTSYALATGGKKYLFKIIEKILFIFLLPIVSILNVISKNKAT